MKPSIIIKVTEQIDELYGEIGLVACDSELANRLVKEGKAEFHHAEQRYETKVMTSKKNKK
jgi:hypothetical protein